MTRDASDQSHCSLASNHSQRVREDGTGLKSNNSRIRAQNHTLQERSEGSYKVLSKLIEGKIERVSKSIVGEWQGGIQRGK